MYLQSLPCAGCRARGARLTPPISNVSRGRGAVHVSSLTLALTPIPPTPQGVSLKTIINMQGCVRGGAAPGAGAKQALHPKFVFHSGRLLLFLRLWGRGRCGGAAAARRECRGATHDGAGVDVIRAALAALRLQGDPGVIICNTKRRNSECFRPGHGQIQQPGTCSGFWLGPRSHLGRAGRVK